MKARRTTTDGRNRLRAREAGIGVGILPTGPWNAITDVDGVSVGHATLRRGEGVRTGVTVVLPHGGNLIQETVPAAIHVGNGFGKLTGIAQVREIGTIETPIALTNTLGVPAAAQALIRHALRQPGNETVASVNPVVGETNDAGLNDIRGMHVTEADVFAALDAASSGPVEEGSVGAGTGTRCFGYKGGIGTSSRRLSREEGGYTVGVLVQTNYGGLLVVNGAPVGRELGMAAEERSAERRSDGSCMIVVATDAPLSRRNLERLAGRAILGLARTGSCMAARSGEFSIAFSTAYRIPQGAELFDPPVALVSNDGMNRLFPAVVEATEEAVYNSMFRAETVAGRDGRVVWALPLDRVIEICRRHGALAGGQRLVPPGVASA